MLTAVTGINWGDEGKDLIIIAGHLKGVIYEY